MDLIECLAASHPNDQRYRRHIESAVRHIQECYENSSTIVMDGAEQFVRHFLMFGSNKSTYLIRHKELTLDMAEELCAIIQSGKGVLILRHILQLSLSGRALRQEPLLFALALCARYQVRDTRSKNLPWENWKERHMPQMPPVYRYIDPLMDNTYQRCLQQVALYTVHRVCLIPTHLFTFINYCKMISAATGLKIDSKGWGRALRATVIKWYYNQDPERLAVLVTRYNHHVGYSNRALFCLSHIHPQPSFPDGFNYWLHHLEYDAIVNYVVKGSGRARKRRQEALEARARKRIRLDPKQKEQILQRFEELSQRQAQRRPAGDVISEQKKYRYAIPAEESRALQYIHAFDELQTLTLGNFDIAVQLILQYGFDQEQVPPELLRSTKIWSALLGRMPLKTMLKYLGKMTQVGVFNEPNDESCNAAAEFVIIKLNNVETVVKERINPVTVLLAKIKYQYGYGPRGHLEWKPNKAIEKALEYTFYNSFMNVDATGKRYLLAIDISESMDSLVHGTMVACSQMAATISMALIRKEECVLPMAFSEDLVPLEWSRYKSLYEYLCAAKKLPFGPTNICLPMKWARDFGVKVDVFIIMTDFFTSADPLGMMNLYRQEMDMPNTKLIVIAMNTDEGRIALWYDAKALLICGVDETVLQVIHDFALGLEVDHQ